VATTGIFVYAMDVVLDPVTRACQLGPGTKRRVAVGVSLLEEKSDAELVFAAEMDHFKAPELTVPMRKLMRDYAVSLKADSSRIKLVDAISFDTDGEQVAFVSAGYQREVHVSDWWHLPRIRLARQRMDISKVPARYCCAGWYRLPLRTVLLEMCKYPVMRFFPGTKKTLQVVVRRIGFRSSW